MERNIHQKAMRWEVIAGHCLIHGYRRGAELGVSHGRFTSFLCSVMHDMHMTSVDLWAAQPENKGLGAETYETWPHEAKYHGFCAHVEKNFPGRVRVIRANTRDAAALVEDGSLDFVFIDADHSYEGASADIRLWAPKVRSGGLISGHDYNWPTTKQAVDDSGPCFYGHDNVWFRFQE
jgi:hypothetical protein